MREMTLTRITKSLSAAAAVWQLMQSNAVATAENTTASQQNSQKFFFISLRVLRVTRVDLLTTCYTLNNMPF